MADNDDGEQGWSRWLRLLREWRMMMRAVRSAEERHSDPDTIVFLRQMAELPAWLLVEPYQGPIEDAARALTREHAARRHSRQTSKFFPKN